MKKQQIRKQATAALLLLLLLFSSLVRPLHFAVDHHHEAQTSHHCDHHLHASGSTDCSICHFETASADCFHFENKLTVTITAVDIHLHSSELPLKEVRQLPQLRGPPML